MNKNPNAKHLCVLTPRFSPHSTTKLALALAGQALAICGKQLQYRMS